MAEVLGLGCAVPKEYRDINHIVTNPFGACSFAWAVGPTHPPTIGELLAHWLGALWASQLHHDNFQRIEA